MRIILRHYINSNISLAGVWAKKEKRPVGGELRRQENGKFHQHTYISRYVECFFQNKYVLKLCSILSHYFYTECCCCRSMKTKKKKEFHVLEKWMKFTPPCISKATKEIYFYKLRFLLLHCPYCIMEAAFSIHLA